MCFKALNHARAPSTRKKNHPELGTLDQNIEPLTFLPNDLQLALFFACDRGMGVSRNANNFEKHQHLVKPLRPCKILKQEATANRPVIFHLDFLGNNEATYGDSDPYKYLFAQLGFALAARNEDQVNDIKGARLIALMEVAGPEDLKTTKAEKFFTQMWTQFEDPNSGLGKPGELPGYDYRLPGVVTRQGTSSQRIPDDLPGIHQSRYWKLRNDNVVTVLFGNKLARLFTKENVDYTFKWLGWGSVKSLAKASSQPYLVCMVEKRAGTFNPEGVLRLVPNDFSNPVMRERRQEPETAAACDTSIVAGDLGFGSKSPRYARYLEYGLPMNKLTGYQPSANVGAVVLGMDTIRRTLPLEKQLPAELQDVIAKVSADTSKVSKVICVVPSTSLDHQKFKKSTSDLVEAVAQTYLESDDDASRNTEVVVVSRAALRLDSFAELPASKRDRLKYWSANDNHLEFSLLAAATKKKQQRPSGSSDDIRIEDNEPFCDIWMNQFGAMSAAWGSLFGIPQFPLRDFSTFAPDKPTNFAVTYFMGAVPNVDAQIWKFLASDPDEDKEYLDLKQQQAQVSQANVTEYADFLASVRSSRAKEVLDILRDLDHLSASVESVKLALNKDQTTMDAVCYTGSDCIIVLVIVYGRGKRLSYSIIISYEANQALTSISRCVSPFPCHLLLVINSKKRVRFRMNPR